MDTPQDQQSYAQGYHVGYQHGLQAAGGQGGPPAGTYPVNLIATYPERSSRLLMFFLLFKWILLIPHLIVLWLLGIGVFFAMIGAWFVVVITGSWSKPLWDFILGYSRWTVRVQAYMVGLTDEYPPFSLN